jgi:hypothetical protein
MPRGKSINRTMLPHREDDASSRNTISQMSLPRPRRTARAENGAIPMAGSAHMND